MRRDLLAAAGASHPVQPSLAERSQQAARNLGTLCSQRRPQNRQGSASGLGGLGLKDKSKPSDRGFTLLSLNFRSRFDR
jgi:hypothetical protein